MKDLKQAATRKREKRAFEAQKRAELPPRDKDRFARWLRSVLNEGDLSLNSLAKGLGKEPREFDSYLLRVQKGAVEPRAEQTFAIGEALHACGVAWCSGPVALWQSNHLGEFVDFVSALAADDGHAAVELVAAIALLSGEALKPPPNDLVGAIFAQLQTRHRVANIAAAREQLKASRRESYAAAWARAIGSNTAAKTQRDAAVDLKIARVVAVAGARERVVVALTEWGARSEPGDDTLRVRLTAARAIAEEQWNGVAGCEDLGKALLGRSASSRQSSIGVGRGKNVG
jgi:hypothetical protein